MNDTLEPAILSQLQSLLGSEHVLTDRESREFYSTDVYAAGRLPLAVVRPASTADVAQLVQLCATQGVALVARGGGASYTDGYTPAEASSVVIDTARMNKILDRKSTRLNSSH